MTTARIFDPAGPTDDFFFDTGAPQPVSITGSTATFRAPILSGPFAGDVAVIQWLGSFNVAAQTGSVCGWRELLHGNLCFSLTFDTPVPLDDLFDRLDAAFAGGFHLIGNKFANRVTADAGNDLIHGGAGNDVLSGAAGADRIFGQSGNDRLVGGPGIDSLFGGAGNDVLDGRDAGSDNMAGGLGNDRYIEFAGNRGSDVIVERPGEGYDVVISYSQGASLSPHVEELRMARAYANAVNAFGNDQANLIVGTSGRDFINSFGGDDRVVAGAGNDLVTGGLGNDTLFGGDGDDEIWDYYGTNELWGGRGNDTLRAGNGKDILHGNAGSDRFEFQTPEAAGLGPTRDLIADFLSGTDKIVLTSIDADTTQPGDQNFTYIGTAAFSATPGEVRVARGVLYGNADDDPIPEFIIDIAGVQTLAAGDLIL